MMGLQITLKSIGWKHKNYTKQKKDEKFHYCSDESIDLAKPKQR